MSNQPRGTSSIPADAALAEREWQVKLQNSPDWPFQDGLSHPGRAHAAETAGGAGAGAGTAPMDKHRREQNPGRPSKVGLPQPGRPQIGTARAAAAAGAALGAAFGAVLTDGTPAPLARQAREQNSFGLPLKVGLLQPARAQIGAIGA
mmetsp:Transcript_35786/g.44195  ORF Transcript_35786/g.44195 Transcript_35786/m.44195 type:complete len:148 (-) Transcript_35786:226-669(-)